MRDPLLPKKFIFNDNFDTEFLFGLYEDDLSYMEEIFRTTIDQVKTVIDEIPGAFASKDIEKLRRMVHKIKPAFGFTGFLQMEKACKEFEDACTDSIEPDDLSTIYQRLWPSLVSGMKVLQNEYEQLKEFNNP
ncbi:MAG TPA: Hpt domain-containing protein [Flavitalea sp.]|nr:Hpt domain-containing protein [Flavitalea sp.]